MHIWGFTNLFFMLVFLPVFLIIYWAVPKKWQNTVMLIGSIIFYGAGDLRWLLLFVVLLLVNYGLYRGNLKAGRRWVLLLTLVIDIGTLVLLKYTGIVSKLPIGVSFYVFQLVSWQLDMWKAKETEPVGFMEYSVFISMFPKLLMGPIVRFADYKDNIRKPRNFSKSRLEDGICLFIFGLGIKLFLADILSGLVTAIRVGGTEALTTDIAWLGAIAYTMELYFDFWGYSKMAVGLGQMTGFSLPDNFRQPYSSKTIGEFYRRWHITLGAWFRDYIYIPMGGSKKGNFITVINLFVVWILTGMWHGEHLNYVIWGLYLFAFIALEKVTPLGRLKNTKVLGHIYVVFFVMISWIIFTITDIKELSQYLLCMFGKTTVENEFLGSLILRYYKQYGLIIGAGFLFMTPLPETMFEKLKDTLWMRLLLIILLNACIYFIWQGQSNPFLYFGF